MISIPTYILTGCSLCCSLYPCVSESITICEYIIFGNRISKYAGILAAALCYTLLVVNSRLGTCCLALAVLCRLCFINSSSCEGVSGCTACKGVTLTLISINEVSAITKLVVQRSSFAISLVCYVVCKSVIVGIIEIIVSLIFVRYLCTTASSLTL